MARRKRNPQRPAPQQQAQQPQPQNNAEAPVIVPAEDQVVVRAAVTVRNEQGFTLPNAVVFFNAIWTNGQESKVLIEQAPAHTAGRGWYAAAVPVPDEEALVLFQFYPQHIDVPGHLRVIEKVVEV